MFKIKSTILRGALIGASLLVGAATSAVALAETFPNRPITVIVPYPAGGGTDIIARTLAHEMETELKVPINVVNRGGGGGIVGATAIKTAKADGYTIGVVASDISLFKPSGLSALTYADFTAIGKTEDLPGGITVKSDSPYTSVAKLLEAIKSQPPGSIKGTGAPPKANWHVGFMGFMLAAGVDPSRVTWVPTQGGTAGQLDVASGNSTFATASLVEARALIESGKLKPLAIMDPVRSPLFPDVPTLEEQGIHWSYGLWHGVLAPKGLPADRYQIIESAVEHAANSEAFLKTLKERGFKPNWIGGEKFEEFMKQDLQAMTELFSHFSEK